MSPTGTGRILYIGAGHAGLFGLVDASEATDTYGSRFNDVRAFTLGGWPFMACAEGVVDPVIPPELRRLPGAAHGGAEAEAAAAIHSEHACPDLRSFMVDFVPTLTSADCVVLLHLSEHGHADVDPVLLRAAESARAAGADVRYVHVVEASAPVNPLFSGSEGCSGTPFAGGVSVRLPSLSLRWEALSAVPPLAHSTHTSSSHALRELLLRVDPPLFAAHPPPSSLGSFAMKLALNALTTGAHVARGVIIGNRMVNMMLTNHKLFLRAIGIVADVAGVEAALARTCIMRSIYALDDDAAVELLEAERTDGEGSSGASSSGTSVAAHIALASVTEKVIPTALMLAMSEGGGGRGKRLGLTVAAARDLLQEQPAVRRALDLIPDSGC